MIKTYCDICKKELADDCHDVVNINFHSFGVSGFELKIGNYKPKAHELNMCVECANKVVECIDSLADLAWMENSERR